MIPSLQIRVYAIVRNAILSIFGISITIRLIRQDKIYWVISIGRLRQTTDLYTRCTQSFVSAIVKIAYLLGGDCWYSKEFEFESSINVDVRSIYTGPELIALPTNTP